MFRELRYITIVVFLSSLCTAAEHGRSVSSREIFFQLCDSVMSDVSRSVDPSRSIAVTAVRDTFTEYFQPLFLQGLMRRNIPVFIKQNATKTTLELTVRESSVFYGEAFTDSFFGSRKTERKSVLTITGTLISVTDGKVVWTNEFTRMMTDTVMFAETELLDREAPPLTSYTRPEFSLFDSILEPAIITIASGVAIYLFFTIRS
jgi:hypothetical protein